MRFAFIADARCVRNASNRVPRNAWSALKTAPPPSRAPTRRWRQSCGRACKVPGPVRFIRISAAGYRREARQGRGSICPCRFWSGFAPAAAWFSLRQESGLAGLRAIRIQPGKVTPPSLRQLVPASLFPKRLAAGAGIRCKCRASLAYQNPGA